MKKIYTVSQINSYIKNMFTQDYMLRLVYVKGEVSNCKYHSSGHIYFKLKDENGIIACVMFAGDRKGLGFKLEDGQQVVAGGDISVYERDGKYQLYARQITLDGAGLLYERFEALKRELEEMGMFSSEHKQPVPKYIKTLGVVTAPTGAVVRDIINVTKRRNHYVQIILYPAIVQGDQAAHSIANGIRALEEHGVDVIVVGRGGGSIEELWAFNEREVAQAVFDCRVPIISAVGHETDTTITDFVADLRVPTPSAAAELAVYQYDELEEKLQGFQNTLNHMARRHIEKQSARLEKYRLRAKYLNPLGRIREKRSYCVDLEERLSSLMNARLEDQKHKLALCAERLKGLSPLEKLSQGYAFVEDGGGKAIRSVRDVKTDDSLCIYVKDGTITARALDAREGKIYGG